MDQQETVNSQNGCTPPKPKTLAEQAHDLLKLDADIKTLDADVKDWKKQRDELKRALAASLAETGLANIKLDSGESVYILRQYHVSKAKGCDEEALIELMRDSTFVDFIKTSVALPTLKSWIKEQDEATEDVVEDLLSLLPVELRPFFNIYEDPTVGIRRN